MMHSAEELLQGCCLSWFGVGAVVPHSQILDSRLHDVRKSTMKPKLSIWI